MRIRIVSTMILLYSFSIYLREVQANNFIVVYLPSAKFVTSIGIHRRKYGYIVKRWEAKGGIYVSSRCGRQVGPIVSRSRLLA